MERLLIIFTIPQAGMSIILSIITWRMKALRHNGIYYQLVETNLHTWKKIYFSNIKRTVFPKPKHWAIEAYKGSESKDPCILNLYCRWGWVITVTAPSSCFPPRETGIVPGEVRSALGSGKEWIRIVWVSSRPSVLPPYIRYTSLWSPTQKPITKRERETTDRIQLNNWWERRTARGEEGVARQKGGGEFGLILYLIRLR